MTKNNKNFQFLGLGCIVEIEHMDALADTLYVILARAVGKDVDGKIILRYQVAPHPQGGSAKQADDIITLAEVSITKVVYEGYLDDKDEAFLSKLITSMENELKNVGSAPKKETLVAQDKEPEKNVVPSPPKVEDDKELLKKDPFYKFR